MGIKSLLVLRKRMALIAAMFLLMLVLISLPETGAAQTCNVPVPYPTVRAAVAHPDCAVIVIAPGIHFGSVTVARTLTLTGAGPGVSVIGGPLLVSGPGTELTLSSLSIDTTGALAGCYPAVLAVTNGALVYPEAIAVSNDAGVPTMDCHVFFDGFESYN
jgi:hypothetical protein